jgi:hypothetical protein
MGLLSNHGRQISSFHKDHQHHIHVIQQHVKDHRSHHDCGFVQIQKLRKSPGSNASCCDNIDTIHESRDLNGVAADSKLPRLDPINLNAESCSSSGSGSGSEAHDDLAAMVNEFMEDAESHGHGTSTAAYCDPSPKINAARRHHQETVASGGANHDGSSEYSVLADEYEGLIRAMQVIERPPKFIIRMIHSHCNP